MIPTLIYRTNTDGLVFETPEDAHAQSVNDAVDVLFSLFKEPEKTYTKSGESLVALDYEIRKGMRELVKALDGKLYSEYKNTSI